MDPNIYPYMTPPTKKKRRWPVVVFCLLCLCVLVAGGMGAYVMLNTVKAQVPAGSRAVVLDGEWGDFFRYPCNVNEEKAHIEEAVAGAKELGADTLLWTARVGGGEACFRDPTKTLETGASITANDKWYEFLNRFDPLKYLVKQANENGLAVVLLATDTEGKAVNFADIDTDCAEAVARQSKKLGLQVAALNADPEAVAGRYDSTAQVLTYNVRGVMDPKIGSADTQAVFLRCDGNVPMLAAAVQYADTDCLILGVYSKLAEDNGDLALLNTYLDGSEAPDLPALWDGREISETLALAYPTETTVNTGLVFLMGTSEPGLPLTISGGTLDGTETVERYGDRGVWGILVEMQQGENHFDIVQEGGKNLAVSLTYESGNYTPAETVSDGSVRAEPGQYLEITATAASALSTAWNDDTISQTLYQGAVAQVMDSVNFTRSNKYTWAYQLASGDWVLAKDCELLEMVPEEAPEAEEQDDKDDEKTDEESDKKTDGKADAADADAEGDKEAAEEDEEEINLVSSVGDAAFTGLTAQYDEATRCTVLTFEGKGTPVIYHNWEDDLLSLAFYSAAFTGELPATDGFIKNIATAELENGFVLNIKCASGQLWGWNSEYTEDGTTKLYLKHTPTISDAQTGPLTGTVVMLDAGHGGDEKGAMGAAGLAAPLEKDVNLAETMAAKYRLEQLGATVLLTRSDDSTLSLQDRLTAMNEQRPDFFIALHHNSTVLTVDVNENKGTECYWFYTEGAALAEHLANNVTTVTGRNLRGTFYDYYYVTRSNICPAVLLETGFMTNPGEYEDVANPTTLLAEGGAVAQAVLQSVQEGFVPYTQEKE